jgi:hypothetical protein
VIIVMSSSGFEQLSTESQVGGMSAWTGLHGNRSPAMGRNLRGRNCIACFGATNELVLKGRLTTKYSITMFRG